MGQAKQKPTYKDYKAMLYALVCGKFIKNR